MSLPTQDEQSRQHFDAAHLSMEPIKNREWEDYKLINPALFLYRHAVKLLDKDLVGAKTKTHDLSKLADQLGATALEREGAGAPPWIVARLRKSHV